MNDVVKLAPGKSDYEKANEYKKRAAHAAEEFMNVLTEASEEGFKFQVTFGENAFGKVIIQHLQLVKVF